MRYSVIIASWNARDALAACLDSVTAQDLDGPLETVVVDNASTELTADLLAGETLASVAARGWFGILIASDVLLTVVAALAFEFAVER